VWSSPAVSGNHIYIGSFDNSIYCLDKNTGKLKWKFETGDDVWSSPAVSGDYVYVGSGDGRIYAFKEIVSYENVTEINEEVENPIEKEISEDKQEIGSIESNILLIIGVIILVLIILAAIFLKLKK